MALRAVPDHPKFAELKAILGQPKGPVAGWLEMMWHFTGRFTPQGNIGKYSDQAIEAWVEWDGAPGKLIEALIQSRWIDGDPVHRLIVHDWAQHADKATKNALIRAKLPFCTPTVRTEGEQERAVESESGTVSRLPEPEPVPVPEAEPDIELSLLSPEAATALCPADFMAAWNEHRGTLPKVLELSDDRRKRIHTRIRKGLTIERFTEAVKVCAATPFLAGQNDRKWRASLDWVIENDSNLLKVLEGKYAGSAAAQLAPYAEPMRDLDSLPPRPNRVISLESIRVKAGIQ